MARPFRNPDTVRGANQYNDAAHQLSDPWPEQAHNVRLVGHSDLSGWGDAFQIKVRNGICYVAASGINGHNGITILDVKDPKNPKVVNQLSDGPAARTHKVLLINEEIMITNSELRPDLRDEYPDAVGGLRVFDMTDPVNPKFMRYAEADGYGIHRPVYDANRKLMYSSGYKDGYDKKVLLIHDMSDPANPEPVGHAWMPGQKDGEDLSWNPEFARSVDCHEGHGFGNYVTAAWWDGGIAILDCEDPSKPEIKWRQNPHETHGWPGCYHTFVVPRGSEFGICAQETTTVNCDDPPAFITFYDMRNIDEPVIASTYMPHDIDPETMRPLDSKWCQTGSRYGAHNLWHDMTSDDLLYICWFNAGLRIVDWSNPFNPKEIAHYMPAGNAERACPQSNDVFVDRETGLIYLSDRWGLGLHILELTV
ncbi:MAG: LVIVD repeat-containing protein [Methyloligellaceae bacterium]